MRIHFLALLGLGLAAPALAETPLESAIVLYRDQKLSEARTALQKITVDEPTNAEACYYYGMTLRHRGDERALDDALPWLEKAVQLQPENAVYLADYGGTSLQFARVHRSLSAATKGRDAMEKSLLKNPGNLDTREGLYQFYTQAPWPLGSSSKAQIHLGEITKRNPDRGILIGIQAKTDAKKYDEAFQLCEGILAKKPDDYIALYQYGRTVSASGKNLERGLACLQKCINLTPPGPSSPQPTHAWFRIGTLQEKLGRPADARAAYETALKLDATNKGAADALAKLK
ncbi:MAG TPA: tetratricopeptide repeat protein [Opitutaceae bacterium]|nr:tetratricopeptide repeat protein [Opitutaceae bacterium]